MEIKELKAISDLTLLPYGCSYIQARRVCEKVGREGYRSACIPSKFLGINRTYYPQMLLNTIVNYPWALHACDVVLRELQGVIGICEDISKIEIEVVCPPEFHANLDLFAQWNHLVPLKLILPWEKLQSCIDLLPTNDFKYPPFSVISFIRPSSLSSYPSFFTVSKDYVKALKDKGYVVKVSGYLDGVEEVERLYEEGVSYFGISNSKIFEGDFNV